MTLRPAPKWHPPALEHYFYSFHLTNPTPPEFYAEVIFMASAPLFAPPPVGLLEVKDIIAISAGSILGKGANAFDFTGSEIDLSTSTASATANANGTADLNYLTLHLKDPINKNLLATIVAPNGNPYGINQGELDSTASAVSQGVGTWAPKSHWLSIFPLANPPITQPTSGEFPK
jgi:hypothetical protein